MEEKKLKIGIDLDDVLTDTITNFVEFCKHKNLKIDPKKMKSYYFYKDLGITMQEFGELFQEFSYSSFGKTIKIKDFAKVVLIKLSSKYELIILTSRPAHLKTFTKNFIEFHFGKNFFKEIIHSEESHRGTKTKAEICCDLNINLIIDDRRKYVEECIKKGINVLLMDKPWNQNCEHKNITRVKDWNEILERLK